MTERLYGGTLAQALQDGNIKPGDRLLLHAGTYTAEQSTLTGTQAKPISVIAYPGERVILDGNFTVTTNWLIFQNVEFTYSSWTSRESAEAGSSPSDIPYVYANLRGNNNKYIGCVFHDLRGCLWYTVGGEMHDCISYFHGWQGPDRKHGHAYYIHNGAIPKRMVNCLGFDSFGYGIALYSATANDPLDNISFEQCVMFGSGRLPAGGDNYNIHAGGEVIVGADNITFNKCVAYDGLHTRIGYNGGATNVHLTNNLFDGLISDNAEIVENTGNEYGAISDRVLVHPSEVIAGRGNIIVYNPSDAESVTVNVSTIMSAGSSYKLHNARDYYADIVTGTVAGNGTITIDMRAASRSIGTPVAGAAIADGFPGFGVFVLEAG